MRLEVFLFNIRTKNNKTIKEMASMLNMTESRYINIETKKVKPQIKEICVINECLKKNGFDGYDENKVIEKYKKVERLKKATRYRNNIRKVRLKRGLTIKELASLINVHRTTIYKWESGLKKPSAEKIEKLEEKLNVKISIKEVVVHD